MNRLLSTLAFGALLGAVTASAAEPIPYFNDCDDLSTVTAIGQGTQSWTVNNYFNRPASDIAAYGFRLAMVNSSTQMDAWLFTHELDLQEGNVYYISALMGVGRTTGTLSGAIALSEDATAESAKTVIHSQTPLKSASNTFPQTNIIYGAYVKADGKNYVGIHDMCKGNHTAFYVDYIKVEAVPSVKAAAPTNVVVTNPSGKEVKVTFNAPSVNVVGDALPHISSVKLMRNGMVQKEYISPAPGAELTFTENAPSYGAVDYTIVAVVDGVEGLTATGTVNVAASVSLNPTLHDDTYRRNSDWGPNYKVYTNYLPGEGVKLHWFPYTPGNDADGHPYPVTYTIYNAFDQAEPLAEGVTGDEWTDTNLRPGLSQLYTYIVEVYVNEGGEAPVKKATYTSQTVSTNNPAPFYATFSNEALYEYGNYCFDYGNGNTYRASFANNIDQTYHPGAAKGFNMISNNNWFVTPGIKLEAGKTYRIDMDMFDNSMVHSDDIDFQLYISDKNDPASMENILIERTSVKSIIPKNYYAFYTPEEDMNAFFGFWTTNPTTTNTNDYLTLSKFNVYEVSADLPAVVENLKVVYSKDDSSKATLSFNAPTKNIAGKAVPAITKIELYKNDILDKTIDSPVAGATCTFDIDIEIGKADNYMVVAYTAAGKGLETTLTVQMFDTPYSNNFNNKNAVTGWEVINPDRAGYSWGIQSGYARCFGGGDGYDDYWISTPIHFEGNYWYKADMTAFLEQDSYYDYTSIELLIGTSPDVESMTKVVIPATSINSTTRTLLKDYFRIDESGDYYLALHAVSPKGSNDNLCVDDLNISAKIDPTVPAPVQNFTVTPDPEGAYSMTVSYDLPTVDLDGNPLEYIPSKVEFYFDEFPTIAMNTYNPKATEADENGVIHKEFTFTHWKLSDLGAKDYLFWVYAYKDNNNKGKEAELKAFIGINKPAPIETFECEESAEEYGKVHFAWEAPTMDIDGYKLNTTALTYDVCRYEQEYVYNSFGEPVGIKDKITKYAEDITDLEYTAVVKENADHQEFCRFFIDAKTSAGAPSTHYISKWIAVGKPYEMPIYESFANMKFTYFTMSQNTHGYSQWGSNIMNPVTGVEPVDGDKGLAMMEVAWADAGSRLYTARVNVTGEQPIFTMYLYNQSKPGHIDDNEVTVEVRDNNMGEFEAVASHTVNEWCQGREGWQKAQVDLSEYVGKTIYLSIDGFAHSYSFIHMDALSLAEKADVDLNLHSIQHPEVYVGAPHSVSAIVKNLGKAASGEFTAKLLLDGVEVASQTCESLEAEEDATISFDNLLTRVQLGFHNYSIVVSCEGDADPIDNTVVAAEFELRDNEYPQVTNVTYEEGDGELNFKWDAPEFSTDIVEVTEDFDGMIEWTTIHTGGLGDWTLLDIDGGAVGGFYNYDMPNVEYGSTQSFFIMDTSDPFFAQDTRYRAHSGDLCLVSSYNIDQTYTEDAIISPLLPGTAQTVKFWCKGLTSTKEYVHFLYSTTDKKLSSFIEMEGQSVGPDWTELSYDLPEGALYFMIVHENLYGGYYFFLDDITYTPLGYGNLVLNGYHVYREGDKMTADGHITDVNWTDAAPEMGATKRYGVSALYNLGESYATEIQAGHSGSAKIEAGDAPVVKAADMAIVITNARGKNVVITNAAGLALASFTATTANRIPMPVAGVYMVTIDNQTTKVIVK